jgi:tRNA G10  N-methylase Trm11
MEYLIRLAQMHETFRRPELEALAVLHNVDLEILEYSDEVRAKKTFFISNISCIKVVRTWRALDK